MAAASIPRTPPELLERVEQLYANAKAGGWREVWLAVAGERELAAVCSRYAKPTSGWTFLHQAAYAGDEGAARALIRLGASLAASSKQREAPSDVATKRGHAELARMMTRAAEHAQGSWEPSPDPDLLPSSSAFGEASPRRAWRDLRVAYAGGIVVIPTGSRHYVDSFDRTLIGWHGTYDPPSSMD